MKKRLATLALILCIFVSAAVPGLCANEPAQKYQDEIDALKKQLETLQGEYDALLAEYNALLEATEAAEEEEEKPSEADYDIDYSSSEVVKLVQQTLNDAGYNCGTPDGSAGANTASAIRSFQTDKGLSTTGTIDFDLIFALGILDEAVASTKEAKDRIGYDTGITYDQLTRTPDDYYGEKVKFRGEVVQMIYDPEETQMRLAVNGDYSDILFCGYDPSIVSSRVLEDDWITIYGISVGLFTYESTMGGMITIPGVWVERIDQ